MNRELERRGGQRLGVRAGRGVADEDRLVVERPVAVPRRVRWQARGREAGGEDSGVGDGCGENKVVVVGRAVGAVGQFGEPTAGG
jgi:hypothetical protein